MTFTNATCQHTEAHTYITTVQSQVNHPLPGSLSSFSSMLPACHYSCHPHLMLIICPSLMNVGPSFSRLSTASAASSLCRASNLPVKTALASLVSQGAAEQDSMAQHSMAQPQHGTPHVSVQVQLLALCPQHSGSSVLILRGLSPQLHTEGLLAHYFCGTYCHVLPSTANGLCTTRLRTYIAKTQQLLVTKQKQLLTTDCCKACPP